MDKNRLHNGELMGYRDLFFKATQQTDRALELVDSYRSMCVQLEERLEKSISQTDELISINRKLMTMLDSLIAK